MGRKTLCRGLAALVLVAITSGGALAERRSHWGNDTRFTVAEMTANSATAPNGSTLFELGAGIAHLGRRFEGSLAWTTSSAPLVTGTRVSNAVVPRFGAHLSWGNKDGALQPFAAIGVPFQMRRGAEIEGRVGLALTGEAGIRAVGCSKRRLPGFCMGMSSAMRYQQNVTEYQLGEAVLPGGSGTLSFPITLFAGVRR